MIQLNLPPFEYKIKEIEGKICIFDVIRRKYLVLTPEEWVRQHFVHLLVNQYQYSKNLIRLEGGLKYNQLHKRSDIVIFDEAGQPSLLIECKAPEVSISQAVIEQASRYNLTLRCRYLAITNGLKTFCFEMDYTTKGFKQLQDLPRRVIV